MSLDTHPWLGLLPRLDPGRTGSCAVPSDIHADPGNRVVPAAGETSRFGATALTAHRGPGTTADRRALIAHTPGSCCPPHTREQRQMRSRDRARGVPRSGPSECGHLRGRPGRRPSRASIRLVQGRISQQCCAELPLKHGWVSWTSNEDADQCKHAHRRRTTFGSDEHTQTSVAEYGDRHSPRPAGPRQRRSSTPGCPSWTPSHPPPASVFPRARHGRSLPRCGVLAFRAPARHRARTEPGRILIPGDGAAGDQGV